MVKGKGLKLCAASRPRRQQFRTDSREGSHQERQSIEDDSLDTDSCYRPVGIFAREGKRRIGAIAVNTPTVDDGDAAHEANTGASDKIVLAKKGKSGKASDSKVTATKPAKE